ncbi:hypothetical protein DUI87_28390 [Hirundo rustica rustica]|uniref:Uncharacterized protein n=1 Tax=Hirundo rustica rustica TaxID=333673 RepID=A0A3M0J2K6_HIRRU|nr:hypothetical protein DUI87_28390 [Hirundo rustica rustica]
MARQPLTFLQSREGTWAWLLSTQRIRSEVQNVTSDLPSYSCRFSGEAWTSCIRVVSLNPLKPGAEAGSPSSRSGGGRGVVLCRPVLSLSSLCLSWQRSEIHPVLGTRLRVIRGAGPAEEEEEEEVVSLGSIAQVLCLPAGKSDNHWVRLHVSAYHPSGHSRLL